MVESSKMAAMGAKKSKGSKSKRVTLKQKYKMIKKVRQTTFQKKINGHARSGLRCRGRSCLVCMA